MTITALLAALSQGRLAWPALLSRVLAAVPGATASQVVDAADHAEEEGLVEHAAGPVIGGTWALAERRGQLGLSI